MEKNYFFMEYTTPSIEIFDVKTEKGFASSPLGIDDFTNDYDNHDW